jgi:hypothetical protein
MSQEESLSEHFAFQPKFLQQLQEDPEGALELLGIHPTEEILSALGQLDETTLKQTMALAQEIAEQKPNMVWP